MNLKEYRWNLFQNAFNQGGAQPFFTVFEFEKNVFVFVDEIKILSFHGIL